MCKDTLAKEIYEWLSLSLATSSSFWVDDIVSAYMMKSSKAPNNINRHS